MRWGPRVSGTECPVSIVDHGQRGQLGPGGPRAVTQRRAPPVPGQRMRRSCSGERVRGGSSPETVEIALR
jgi:hypothetical protein